VAALSNIQALPAATNEHNLSIEDKGAIWAKFREHGPIKVEPLSPHLYAYEIITDHSLPSGAHVAWYVARNYMKSNLKNQRMIYWHLSGIAFTIWLTRHWSTDQLIEKAYVISKTGSFSLVQDRHGN